MVKLSILAPDATTNYVTNPALRYDTTGWNASGATITRDLNYARFGIASLKVVTNGSTVNEGSFFRVSSLTNINEPLTASVYIRGAGRVRLRVIVNPTGQERISETLDLRSDRWQRLSATVMSIGSNDVRLYVETNEGSAKVRTFYVDGAQLERKAYASTYCDGDQPGCRWNGIYHNSTAQRSAFTRAGGRWIQIGGEERQAEDLYMTVAGGLGMASIQNNTQDFALAPGSYFQNKKIQSRVITLTFFAKKMTRVGVDTPVTLSALHQLRQLLIDVVKPDKTGGDEEVWFQYQDGDKPVFFQARYDGGLEGEWDIRNQWINSFPLRLLAVSPLMYEDSQEVSLIDFQNTTANAGGGGLGRIDGAWRVLPLTNGNQLEQMEIGTRGEVYIVGQTTVGYWDGTTFTTLGSGIGIGFNVYNVAVAANGNVYVTGDFTTIGGVAANRVAYWNGSSWNALGTGLNGVGLSIKIAPNGDVYVGGSFTTAGGVSCVRIARWDGLQWMRVGQYGGLNNDVNVMDIARDGTTLYCGGIFTDQNGLAANALLRVAKYNISTGLFSAMGNGFNAEVDAIKLASSGLVYAGGDFTASGSTTINRISLWNGSAWVAMGNGLDNIVWDIQEFKNGTMLIVGQFLYSGTILMGTMTFWNGSTFYRQDINPVLISTDKIFCALIDPYTDDIYVAGRINTNAPLRVAGITTVTNPGTAEVYPTFYVLGSGNLYFIENQSTGKRLYLNLSVLANEEVFIDLGKGTFASKSRSNLFYTLIPGSDFRSFTLLPGDNKLAVFMENDVGAQMQISFSPAHWSADAVQNEESL